MSVPQIVEHKVPEHLTRVTSVPGCDPESNGDLVRCVGDLRDALARANADKAAIRAALNTEAAR